jgi:lipopolysaccharide transport system ATP-binding protein
MSSESVLKESSIPLQWKDISNGKSQSQQVAGDIAVRVHNLSKCYQLYDRPEDRLKQAVYPRLRRLLGMAPRNYAREFLALKDVSFDVKKGETVGIIGRNGSGKSTLLQLICGTLNPTSGTIETQGRIAALLELGSGFSPEFTGRENVYMNAAVLGLQKEEVDARFDDILAFADIGDFIGQPVKTYSSGMMVRLAFAVIAHVDADILIVDEALAVGDAFFVQKCMRFLRRFMDTGTVLFVSHDTGAVLNLCNRAMWINKGQINASGTAKDVVERFLEDIHIASAGEDVVGRHQGKDKKVYSPEEESYRDMRDNFVNSSSLRNDIEIGRFKPEGNCFGAGGASIISTRITDHDRNPLSWVVGGESIILEISAITERDIHHPIIGFQFKDRLGQVIFSDNTYLMYANKTINVAKGQKLVARFDFRMPRLPTGDYSIDPAIAEGTQANHVQHQWLRDALTIKVHASSICLGLVGVPMKNISLEIE